MEHRDPEAAPDWQRLVLRRFDQEDVLHLRQFFGHSGGEVVGLAPVLVEIVELPDVLVRRPLPNAGRQPRNPWDAAAHDASHPTVVIDGAAAHDFEILGEQLTLRRRIAERIGETDAVDRVLLDAVHRAGRRDADDLVDRRDNVVDVVKLRPRGSIGLDLRRPADGHRVARAAEMRGQELRALVGRAAGPGPSRMVHGVGLGRAEHVEPAELLERRHMLTNGAGNAVLRQEFADRAVLALRRGAVIAPDVEDQRIVAIAEPVDLVDDPAGLDIDVFGEAGRHFHQAALEGPLVLGMLSHDGIVSCRGVSLASAGIQPFSLARSKTRSR